MADQRITFQCKLLEDLHSGSGLGRLKAVDDTHARDAEGRPVVWYSMLMGLLRDVAEELSGLNYPAATIKRIQRLFGTEGNDAESRSAVVCRSLHFEREGPASERAVESAERVFVNVTSTSREVHSRRPLDETLRTLEYAVAGLVAPDGELRFHGDDEDGAFLKLCLRRLLALGGGRTRGAGRIQLSKIRLEPLSADDSNVLLKGPTSRRVRMVLKSLEPLCLPATADPGNILETQNYLPGQALRGAFLTAFRAGGLADEQMALLAGPHGAQFTNGYFVGRADAESRLPLDLGHLISVPLPLTAQEVKATGQTESNDKLPWWAKSTSRDRPWWSDPLCEQDTLWQDRENGRSAEGATTFKRVKTEDYLISTDGMTWKRHRPAVTTLMRNRTPVARQDRDTDSRRPNATEEDNGLEKADLFSEIVLVEDQYFVCELVFETNEAANVFQQAAVPLLAKAEDQRAWVRVGRGGRPMRIERVQWLANPLTPQRRDPPGDKPHCFSVTLTSDLIVRAPNLSFRTTLDAETLAETTDCDTNTIREIAAGVVIDYSASVVETCVLHGFNTAAGVRRTPALAIRRGSAFLVGPDGDDTKPADWLFELLAKIELAGHGIGERKEEGFGRFVLNHPAHQPPSHDGKNHSESDEDNLSSKSTGESATEPPEGSRGERERVLAAVLEMAAACGLRKAAEKKGRFPGRSQWQSLRHQVEAMASTADRPVKDSIDTLVNSLADHARTLGGQVWSFPVAGKKPLHEVIKQQLEQQGSTFRRQMFLIYLCRWVVAQLDRVAEQKRRKDRGEEYSHDE